MSNVHISYMVMEILNGDGNAIEVQYNAQEEVSFKPSDTDTLCTDITFDFEELASVYNTIAAVRLAISREDS